jgi:hypothetical protein
MLPIEHVFNDISEEFSKKTKCSVDVPDGATIRRLGDRTEDKYIEELGQAPKPPSRSPPAPPASLTNRERLGGPDDSLEHLPQVNSNSLALDPAPALGIATNAVQFVDSRTQSIENWRMFYQLASSVSKATGPSSDHVQPAFSVRREGKAIEPASPSAPAQKSPEMQQIGSPFGSYPPLTSYLNRPVATNEILELPLPAHKKPLSKPNHPFQEEAGPSSSTRRDNSDDLGLPPASRNPYRASMMTMKPAPAQLPSSGHIGSLPPPSRKAPTVPRVEHPSGVSLHQKPSIIKGFRKFVRRYCCTIFASPLLLAILLGPFAASGYLIYFIVRKRHFSTVAKGFSIWGAVSISLVLPCVALYLCIRPYQKEGTRQGTRQGSSGRGV